MTPRDQNQLLRELLSGREVSSFRQSTLETSLKHLRQHQKRRQRVRVGGAAMCLFLLLSAGILSWLPKPPNPAEILVAHPAADIGSEVKLINDEELFRLFPGRSLALIGKPGEQKLIFLDEEADSTKPGL